jgi:hypothetical protein
VICTAVKHLIADIVEDVMFMFDPADAAAGLWERAQSRPQSEPDPFKKSNDADQPADDDRRGNEVDGDEHGITVERIYCP